MFIFKEFFKTLNNNETNSSFESYCYSLVNNSIDNIIYKSIIMRKHLKLKIIKKQ